MVGRNTDVGGGERSEGMAAFGRRSFLKPDRCDVASGRRRGLAVPMAGRWVRVGSGTEEASRHAGVASFRSCSRRPGDARPRPDGDGSGSTLT